MELTFVVVIFWISVKFLYQCFTFCFYTEIPSAMWSFNQLRFNMFPVLQYWMLTWLKAWKEPYLMVSLRPRNTKNTLFWWISSLHLAYPIILWNLSFFFFNEKRRIKLMQGICRKLHCIQAHYTYLSYLQCKHKLTCKTIT